MWDRLRLKGKDLSYKEIAENIRLLHTFAVELSIVRLTVSHGVGSGADV
jgi:hypothetical protein